MKLRVLIINLFCFVIFFSCGKGKNDPESCNGENTRRDIKLLVDEEASEIDTIPIITTVDSIGSIDLIKANSDTPRQDIEKRIFTITAEVDKVKKHRDGDWKVKLVDDNEKYLNCEVPNTGCSYVQESMYLEEFQLVRDWIEANEGEIEGEVVTITGVAFIDIDHHYPRNNSENEIELHPIIAISFE